MHGWGRMTLAVLLLLSGCRTASRVKEVPRVDLELNSTGNRGYLLGKAPAAEAGKTTREIVETDVEIPSLYRPKHGASGPGLDAELSPPERETPEIAVPRAAGRYDTYVVQKGESLWTIAAKPEVYGKASAWRRLYDANRDLLKNPDSVRAGMKLKIPRSQKGRHSGDDDTDEGTTYHK